jgi:hypothetical protein
MAVDVATKGAVPPPARKRLPALKSFTFADFMEKIFIDYRWMIVIPIVLPMSFLFTQFWAVRDFGELGVFAWVSCVS